MKPRIGTLLLFWGSWPALGLAFVSLSGLFLHWWFPEYCVWDNQMHDTGPMWINAILLLVFGLQHSLMARKKFKEQVKDLLSESGKRSLFVIASSGSLLLLSAFWQMSTRTFWDFSDSGYRFLAWGGFAAGLIILAVGALQMDGSGLIGIRQYEAERRGIVEGEAPFRIPGLYRYTRHPLYLGTLLLFWSAPVMSLDHLIFALGMTIYVLIGIYFEERDLRERFGQAYLEYQRNVPMLIPFKRGFPAKVKKK